jgi:heat shock protein HtpX
MSNQIRTTILLALLTAFLVWIGGMIGGRGGMLAALILAAGMNFFSYWYSDRIVLSMYRAEAVTPEEAPELHDMVRQLAARAGLPMPRIYVIPGDSPNAFATGRNPEHAVVAVTEGLLRLMDREELMGVLAHELGHVRNRDILIGSIAATMAGAVMMLASMARWSAIFGGFRDDEEGGIGGLGLIVMSILAPIAAMLIQMAVSRSREYLADETAARLTGGPEGLSRALEKLGAYAGRLPMHARPETAHMFIVNPLSGQRLMNLFSTHPPLAERIARLRGNPPGSGGRRPRGGHDNIWDRLSG